MNAIRWEHDGVFVRTGALTDLAETIAECDVKGQNISKMLPKPRHEEEWRAMVSRQVPTAITVLATTVVALASRCTGPHRLCESPFFDPAFASARNISASQRRFRGVCQFSSRAKLGADAEL